MRYISRNCIRPDAVLAKPILGPSGEVLLSAGVKMKASYIKRMERMGIAGAYVNDPVSEDLEIVNALSDELKTQAVQGITAAFSQAVKGRGNTQASGAALMKTAEQIVEEILAHGDVMLNLFDMKVFDSYTFFHSVSVTVLSVVIGLGLGFSRLMLVSTAYAALLHDIGKVLISAHIINKPSPLTPEEFEIVKKHPQDGYNYIKEKFSLTVSELSARAVLEHHERVDGTGYPAGKTGDVITPIGKVIAVADVYDALVSDRPYRKGVFPVEAMEYIQGNCGTLFDFDVVNVFSQKAALFPVGSCVLLSNGLTALVMQTFEGLTQRPLVKVFMDGDIRLGEPYLVNLSEEALDVTVVAQVDIA